MKKNYIVFIVLTISLILTPSIINAKSSNISEGYSNSQSSRFIVLNNKQSDMLTNKKSKTKKKKKKKHTSNYLDAVSVDNTKIPVKKTMYYSTREPSVLLKTRGVYSKEKKTFRRTFKLKLGKNTIPIKVRTKNKKTKVYVLYIQRRKPLSSNKDVLVTYKAKPIEFQNLHSNKITIPTNQSSIQFDYKLKDPRSTALISHNTGLSIGPNIVSLVVTAQDKSSDTYNINVFRQEKPIELQIICTILLNLIVILIVIIRRRRQKRHC